jgi:hypothetical protein
MGTDENAVQRDLIRHAQELLGVLAIRINSGRVKVRGGWMTLAPIGTPDLLFVLFGGRCCWLECKTPAGKLSADQARMHAELRRRGHVVIVASSRVEFLAGLAAYEPALIGGHDD